ARVQLRHRHGCRRRSRRRRPCDGDPDRRRRTGLPHRPGRRPSGRRAGLHRLRRRARMGVSAARKATAVLISGRGSNLQALLDAARDTDYPARIVRVIANVPDAGGLKRAEAAGVATSVIDHRAYKGRPAFEAALDQALRTDGVELICLAGFMRLLTADFVDSWRDRLINVHPSLLPAFPGLDT